MLLVSFIGTVSWSHPLTLWYGKESLALVVFSVWGVVGASFISEREVVRLAWFFCGYVEEKSVAGYSLMPFLDSLEGKKQQGIWRWGSFGIRVWILFSL